jgi:hypothetical protein
MNTLQCIFRIFHSFISGHALFCHACSLRRLCASPGGLAAVVFAEVFYVKVAVLNDPTLVKNTKRPGTLAGPFSYR